MALESAGSKRSRSQSPIAVPAIQDVQRRILAEGGIQEVDKDIVLLGEIFRLQDMDEVKGIERRFLR